MENRETEIFRFLKTVCLLIFFLISTFSLAQNHFKINEELPSDSEKLELILPKIYWFTKSKITLGDFGIATIKEGITSTESTRKKGVSYTETKQKISIFLENTTNSSANLEARTIRKDEVVVAGNSFLNRFLDIGIESEEIVSMAIYPKTFIGTITTNQKDSKPWDLILTIVDQDLILNLEVGILTSGERTINVIQTRLDSLKNISGNEEDLSGDLLYEFIENGISLGAVTYDSENSIWLKPGLDLTTKLILCTAMISIAY